MAAKAKKNYVVNQEDRTVSFVIGTLTAEEEAEVDKFQTYGYTVIADATKKRKAIKGVTYEDMKKKAKGKPFEKELLEKIASKENYMKVRKWFLEQTK